MRKEVILAVIIGVLLGGVILYGINLANNSSKINLDKQTADGNESSVTPSVTNKPTDQVTIIYPLDNSVITEARLTLKGSTKPNSSIAIITESDDIITTADGSGNYSSEISLISGENIILVTAVDEKQASSSAVISVIRTTTLPE